MRGGEKVDPPEAVNEARMPVVSGLLPCVLDGGPALAFLGPAMAVKAIVAPTTLPTGSWRLRCMPLVPACRPSATMRLRCLNQHTIAAYDKASHGSEICLWSDDRNCSSIHLRDRTIYAALLVGIKTVLYMFMCASSFISCWSQRGRMSCMLYCVTRKDSN